MLSSPDPIWGFGREGTDPDGSMGTAEVMEACRPTPTLDLPLEEGSLPVLGLGELLVVLGWGQTAMTGTTGWLWSDRGCGRAGGRWAACSPPGLGEEAAAVGLGAVRLC